MSLRGLLSAIAANPAYQRQLTGIHQSTPSQPVPPVTIRPGARPAYIGALWCQLQAPILVLTPRPEDARRLHDQLLTYLGEDAPAYLLPEPEVLPFERLAVDSQTGNQRLTAMAALASIDIGSGESPGGRDALPPLVVASIGAALRLTLPPLVVASRSTSIAVGERVRINELLAQWVDLGYRNEPLVEAPGSFSQRGGIIDVFPSDAVSPYRIELFDDEVDTIRRFDPYSQRSVAEAKSITLIPAKEQLPNVSNRQRVEDLIARLDFKRCTSQVRDRFEDELVSLFSAPNNDVLPFYNGLLNHSSLLEFLPESAFLILERDSQIEAEALELEERFQRMRATREDRGELPEGFPSPYQSWAEFQDGMQSHRLIPLHSWVSDDEDRIFQPALTYYGRLEQLASDLRRYQAEGRSVVAVTQHAGRVAEVLEQDGIGVAVSGTIDDLPDAGSIRVAAGSLPQGWALDWTLDPAPGTRGDSETKSSLVLLTDAELFGTVKERRYRRTKRVETGPDIVLSDLSPGSYVVHIDHGVARFAGTHRMGNDEDEKEYLVLEYADNDKLYVPTDHLDRVTAYIGAQDQPPNLTRLSTAEWSRIKAKVKGATQELAEELLKLHAARQEARGHEFGPDTTWQRELEDSFPYEETPDQAQAIDQVKTDMEIVKPMDRLICGDVGYGKTEVALRAAFKTVNDGLQVGMLVPTTVLAQQHYATFSERLSPYPVRVEVLSRFRTPKEQQEVVEGLKDGSVDIVIGTHRLLQKDVSFKNLGLAVVDEEQRFGVAHKERLKQLRREVDVLTLSATPIPRTLNQALSGMRDLSTMDTPPEARLPVKTFVSEYSEDVIKEAILRELERNGQVFFLHNRVKTIHQTAVELSELVPQARIAVGHGQMPEADLEDVMLSFAAGEADVLVCTTIIESGLDMPNVNTLILDRADRFGLSQLYQLRGRVGRGEHRAYAYLMLPRGRRITESAEKRIQAILEASDLGSGFRIAMRDLEIRGAGNLLGAAQSGHIHDVGLELYSQLLHQAVEELKRQQNDGADIDNQTPAGLPRLELPLPARIPDSYMEHLPSRLAVYQRIARIKDRSQVGELREDLRDRFGPLPPDTENLLVLADFRALAGSVGIESVVHQGESINLALGVPVGGARVPLQKALGPAARVGNQQIQLSMRQLGENWMSRLTMIIQRFQAFQDSLRNLAPQTIADE
ncbi:MAG: transcription-repair coupling factor [SAR202 cluster bacterium Io17-Chloro-G2]|nr:MAG: transcription-repair coupling factor [SAR202 cluster bacterium Io17-Chloro-G2]